MSGLLDWIGERRASVQVRCEPVAWSKLSEWRLEEGRFVHRTGGFFQIAGLRAHARRGGAAVSAASEQPIILQPEIGILGFVVRRETRGSNGPEILLQAKAEPGNVMGVQIGPSVQATESNYRRKHGGLPTPYLELFLEKGRAPFLADSLQSEQGTRFLGKYNRNATVDATGLGLEPAGEDWRWFPAADLFASCDRGFLVNTDARSSLVCSSWEHLADSGTPFSRWRGTGEFGERLYESHAAQDEDSETPLASVLLHLAEQRQTHAFETSALPLGALRSWTLDDERIVDVGEQQFEVRGYQIAIPSREVVAWDQPLVHSLREGTCALLCQMRRGVLHFLLRGSVEIGFRECVQYGPTLQAAGARDSALVESELAASVAAASERVASLESDEGGRFHQSVVRYAIRELDERHEVAPRADTRWVTLAQIRALAARKGVLSNEARSAVSLLLRYL